MPDIKEIDFIGSFPNVGSCPAQPLGPEFAFIGRSNVGKSSLINMITNRKSLAKVSGTPGKTQLINYFLVDKSWYLVDLPGYGYARISKKQREKWKNMINTFLRKRLNLYCVFVLLDANIPPQTIDIEFINWLGEHRIPFVLVYTKVDRMTKNEQVSNIQAIRKALLNHWNELPQEFVSSATKGEGREAILAFIDEVIAG